MNTYIIEFLSDHYMKKCAIRASNEKSAVLIARKELQRLNIPCRYPHVLYIDNSVNPLNKKRGETS